MRTDHLDWSLPAHRRGTLGNSEQSTADARHYVPQSEESSMQLTFGDAEGLGKRKQTRREI
ncbi:hypothetical protein, partial [Xanthomonas hortorum]|uniref:hypothetical protein n=1 Tax=Xanthomonas hortorum TaxID=56454 RepID=UPI001F3EB3A4